MQHGRGGILELHAKQRENSGADHLQRASSRGCPTALHPRTTACRSPLSRVESPFREPGPKQTMYIARQILEHTDCWIYKNPISSLALTKVISLSLPLWL